MGRQAIDLSERFTVNPHAWLTDNTSRKATVGATNDVPSWGTQLKPKTDSAAYSFRRNGGELVAVGYYTRPTGFKDKWDPANQRKCYLPPSSYTQTFTDPNALFPPIDKSYVAPGGRKPTMLTPSGKTYREARALAVRNRGTWNPEAAGRVDVFRFSSMHSLQYNKKIVSNNQNFHPGIARANTINMHSRMTEYPNDAKFWAPTFR